MRAAEIRSRFLAYFERQGHVVRPSASLIPADDPTLMFVNAGMVPFKKVFLGQEPVPGGRRVVTAQKCVRAGGKHNDLEQVGYTARHHTFFEMMGNFSFGDYFKRDAIRFGWEFVTTELKLPREHLRVSVYEKDDEARALWKEIAGLPDSRIYGLGERDNFWQMADTGPCGPCSEIFIDLAQFATDWTFPEGASGEWTSLTQEEFSKEAFVQGAEEGRFLEFWNLVFMQYDRQPDGRLEPLPKPSVDTGLGLDRTTAIVQRVSSNYHTEHFRPLLDEVGAVVGRPYADDVSYRVIADHARAAAFLLADGVFPSNEGRGYVLRRILRRGVRHAWLLGRTEPTLHQVAARAIDLFRDAYPGLEQRRSHIIETTRAEEERFLATIEGGMKRFDQLAPAQSTQGSAATRGTISGEDAFRLYDTFGFPLDLTELMARERGYTVDTAGFERALGVQRTQSKEERKSKKVAVGADDVGNLERWESLPEVASTRFVGHDTVEIETQVTALRRFDGGRVGVLLRETPFYAESGGQISDQGEIVGDGWRLDVEEVRKVAGRNAAIGTPSGEVKFGRVVARVPSDRRRDTERNHTATHLLHAALRQTLGDHVHQAGSLVAPDRLRFDFTHHGPVKAESLDVIEELVNRWIWNGVDVGTREMKYADAVAQGAMALFGEKYGDVVRVVSVPGFSVELCGGTHVRNTAQIGLFRIVSEGGVAAGVRRIEAATGMRAFELMRQRERTLQKIADGLRVPIDGVEKRVHQLVEDRKSAEKRPAASSGGGDRIATLLSGASRIDGARLVAASVEAADVNDLKSLGDSLRDQLGTGVGVLGAAMGDGKNTLLVVVTDDLKDRGVSADAIVKALAAAAGGRGGGKPHMAQAGIPDASRIPGALAQAPEVVRPLLGGKS